MSENSESLWDFCRHLLRFYASLSLTHSQTLDFDDIETEFFFVFLVPKKKKWAEKHGNSKQFMCVNDKTFALDFQRCEI